ncbi:MAG: endonuclease [Calditrichia bacterium]|nr:endonuclease [Calditrichia bacterium]
MKFYIILFIMIFLNTALFSQKVSLSVSELDFGSVAAYEEHSRETSVYNGTTEAVQITAADFEEDVFSTDLALPASIPANSTLNFNIYFESAQNVNYIDFLRIEIDGGAAAHIIEVSAQCTYGNAYYTATQNLWGSELKTVLYNIINDHDVQSYTPGVWNAFATTDIFSADTIWDMYSFRADNSADYYYILGDDQDQGTGGDNEGDVYNREHSFPQSWFKKHSPMVTDLFHIFATDKHVNGKRSNFPYGEVGSASWTSTNGSKLGTCSYPGYTGTVFEPIDVFKGDFARGHLYMATRYENVITSWDYDNINYPDAVLNGTEDQVFELWTLRMLLDWHESDLVSTKETNRNNAVFAIQENRNPYIDHPGFAERIWNNDGVVDINQPEIAVTPNSLLMGTVGCLVIEEDSIVVINTGNSTLNISSIGSTNPDFSTNVSSLSIPAENIAFIKVSFTSTETEGEFSTTIQMNTTDSDEGYIEILVSINVNASSAIPENNNMFKTFTLNSIYPNPFNPVTNISFSLMKTAQVTADLYNLQGQKIKTLFQKQYQSGDYSVPVNLAGQSSGIYILSLSSPSHRFTKKIVLLK